MAQPAALTARQQKWFDSVRESFERETGKTLDEWAQIARACPETRPAARKAWLKTHHGLGTNRASLVLGAAFPETAHWAEPDKLRETLWADAGSRAILEAVEAAVADYPGLVTAQRKGFTAFSREFQFAAIRPLKGGGARLGLALDPAYDPRLLPPSRETWSERLHAVVDLASPTEVNSALGSLLHRAADRS